MSSNDIDNQYKSIPRTSNQFQPAVKNKLIIITNLKLLLLLFLQQFQFSELLFPKVVFIIKRLILFIAINDFGSSRSDNNAIYLEFPRAFSGFLFQIHFGNVFLGQRGFSNNCFASFFRTKDRILCLKFSLIFLRFSNNSSMIKVTKTPILPNCQVPNINFCISLQDIHNCSAFNSAYFCQFLS